MIIIPTFLLSKMRQREIKQLVIQSTLAEDATEDFSEEEVLNDK